MELQLLTLAPRLDEPAGFIRSDAALALNSQQREAQPEDALAEVLFEQLAYLIQYADEEPDRFRQVKALLLATFN